MIYLITFILASLVGGAFIFGGYRFFQIIFSRPRFLASFIASVLLILVILSLGWGFFKGQKLSFQEYWNGYETGASVQTFQCSRDGPCAHEYNCDPYTVVEVVTTTDANGNVSSHVETHTEYHSCPYVTAEFSYFVQTTLDNFTIASHIFDGNPVAWRGGHSIPDSVPRGAPQFWLDVAARIQAGHPGPVTVTRHYDNYILASDKSILNQYSDQIKTYLDQKLLPPVTNTVHDFYHADKAHFVGLPIDPAWQNALDYFNAFLGSNLQGDLHLVLVNSAQVSNPDAYLNALKAYWSDVRVWGNQTISKNAIIVIIGTDGNIVTWARAQTGMPIGNEVMLRAIANNLKEIRFTPQDVLGLTSSEFYDKDGKTKVRGVHNTGALEKIIWGLDNPATKFARVSMSGGNANDNGSGFKYLESQIEPDPPAQIFLVILCLIIVAAIFGGNVWYLIEQKRENSYGYYGQRSWR